MKAEKALKDYTPDYRYLDGDRLGVMNLHTLTSPLIEVAEDGKTAKGVWVSPGIKSHETDFNHQAYWSWSRYGVDFIKEDNKWKIWHLLMCGMFRTPFEKSWVEAEPVTMSFPQELKADRPSTYHWMWRPRLALQNVPEIPEPYEKWRESKAYMK